MPIRYAWAFEPRFFHDLPGECSREDSNLHGLPHTVLSRTRLPIPPRERERTIKIARADFGRKPKSQSIFGRGVFFWREFQVAELYGLCLTNAADQRN